MISERNQFKTGLKPVENQFRTYPSLWLKSCWAATACSSIISSLLLYIFWPIEPPAVGISFRTRGLAADKYWEVVISWPVLETAVEFLMAKAAMEAWGMPQRAAAAAAACDWMDWGVSPANPAAVCLRAGCMAAREAWQLTAFPAVFLRSGQGGKVRFKRYVLEALNG